MLLSKILKQQDIKFIHINVAVYVQRDLTTGKIDTKKRASTPKKWNTPDFWIEDYIHHNPYEIKVKYLEKDGFEITNIEFKKCLLIPTGPLINQLMCVDIDSTEFVDILETHNIDAKKIAQTVSCRKKLPHIYFWNETEEDFDVSGKFYNEDKEIGDLKAQFLNGKIDCMWEEDIDLPNFEPLDLDENYIETLKLYFKKPKPKPEPKPESTEPKKYNSSNKEERELYAKYIDILAQNEFDEYLKWIGFGFMFKKLGNWGFDLWNYFSSKSDKYEGRDELWDRWETLEVDPERTGIGKLMNAARKNNKKEFWKIYNAYHYSIKRKLIMPIHKKSKHIKKSYKKKYFESIPVNDHHCVYLYGLMGGGKSTSIDDYLKIIPKDYKVLIISSRVTMAEALSKKFNTSLYNDIKYFNDLDYKKLNHETHLCIQMESLTKLDTFFDSKYVIILDETESLLAQLTSSETYRDNLHRVETNRLFSEIIRNSQKAICAEAFVLYNSIHVLESILGEELFLIHNEYPYPKREVIITKVGEEISRNNTTKNITDMSLSRIIDLLQAGKKVYIVHSSKNMLKLFQDVLSKYGFKGMSYYGGQDDRFKQDFKNVDEAWKDLQYVQTTTTLTVGVSYDRNDFDCAMMVVGGGCALVRDLMQTLYRVRYLREAKIYLFTMMNYSKDVYLNKKDIYKKYDLISKEFDYDDEGTEWIKINVTNHLLEQSISSRFFDCHLDDYLEHINCTFKVEEMKQIYETETTEKKPNKEIQKIRTKVYKNTATDSEINEFKTFLVKKNFPHNPEISDIKFGNDRKLIKEIQEKIYSKTATESEKVQFKVFLVNKYFPTVCKEDLLRIQIAIFDRKINLETIEIIKAIKYRLLEDPSCEPFLYDNIRLKARFLNELLNDLGVDIDSIIEGDKYLVPKEELDAYELDFKMMKAYLTKRISSDDPNQIIRRLLSMIGLKFDAKRSTAIVDDERVHIIRGYTVTDYLRLWKYL